jgi:carboxyl-terminal processing protease
LPKKSFDISGFGLAFVVWRAFSKVKLDARLYKMKKVLRSVLLSLFLASIAIAQSNPPLPFTASSLSPDDSKSTAEIRKETFDIVWRTVRDKHFDPTLGGVDWQKVREKYEPRVSTLNDNNGLYALLQEMLGELHQSHFNIIPPEAIIPDDVKEPPMGGIGIDVRIIDGQAVVTNLEPESKAALAGIKTGFIIKKIDDTTVEQLYERALKRKEKPGWANMRTMRAVLSRINGKPETSVRLLYLDGRNKAREVTLQRQRLKGELSKRLGNFPPQYTEFEARRLANNIGYIRFNTFVPILTERIREAVKSMHDTAGVIFDLRGNPGGLGIMANGIAGLLSNQRGSLGSMKSRVNETHFVVFPQSDANLRPVVILIDGGSASTSEIFAGGMQELGRATIIGERSLGAALPSTFQKLPTGALFQYAIADFKTPKGVLIEGRGVIPDIEVKWNRSALLNGRDVQLESATEQILKRSKSVANAR